MSVRPSLNACRLIGSIPFNERKRNGERIARMSECSSRRSSLQSTAAKSAYGNSGENATERERYYAWRAAQLERMAALATSGKAKGQEEPVSPLVPESATGFMRARELQGERDAWGGHCPEPITTEGAYVGLGKAPELEMGEIAALEARLSRLAARLRRMSSWLKARQGELDLAGAGLAEIPGEAQSCSEMLFGLSAIVPRRGMALRGGLREARAEAERFRPGEREQSDWNLPAEREMAAAAKAASPEAEAALRRCAAKARRAASRWEAERAALEAELERLRQCREAAQEVASGPAQELLEAVAEAGDNPEPEHISRLARAARQVAHPLNSLLSSLDFPIAPAEQ